MAIPFFVNDDNECVPCVPTTQSTTTTTTVELLHQDAPMQIQIVLTTAKPNPSPSASAAPANRRRRSSIFTLTCDKAFVLDGLILNLTNNNEEVCSNSDPSAVIPVVPDSRLVPDTDHEAERDEPDSSFADIGTALREIADSYQLQHGHGKQVELHEHEYKFQFLRTTTRRQLLQTAVTLAAGGLLGIAAAGFIRAN